MVEAVYCPFLEFFALPALGLSVAGEENIIALGGCPVMPAVGCGEDGGKGCADGFGLFGFLELLFVEDAEEEHPGDFGHVLKCSGAVGTAHDVANGFYVAVEGLLGVEFTTVAVIVFCGACHGKKEEWRTWRSVDFAEGSLFQGSICEQKTRATLFFTMLETIWS